MKLGIAIPTYKDHLKYIEDILSLLQKSTIKPDQVSISCSSLDYEYSLDDFKYDFDIIFTSTPDIKNPAENRNIAASKLTTDIISFIDGDDYPHIQRNEFILKSFENKEVVCLVHDYYKSPQKNDIFLMSIYNSFDLKINYIDIVINMCATNKFLHLDYHHAQISVLRNVFEKIKFNEDELYKFREDSIYTKTLIDEGYKISLLTNKLLQYNKN